MTSAKLDSTHCVLGFLLAAVLGSGAWAQSTPVETQRLMLNTAVVTDTYFGTVRASDIVSLSYGARGCVVAVNDGAKRSRVVSAGQVLVGLDDQRAKLDLQTAEARVLDLTAAIDERVLALTAARADERRRKEELDFVSEEFERNSVLQGRGLINETTMEAIERRFMDATFTAERSVEAIANAEAAVKRAELALNIGKLDVETAKLDLAEFEVAAPFDGVLVGFDASLGDCVQEGELAASIYKPSEKSVDVFFPISRLAAPQSSGLSIGAPVEVTRVNDQTCAGIITRLDTQADPETQFVEATVDVDEACAPNLFLNEAVEIEAVQSKFDNAFTVPNTAISGDNIVFLVDEGAGQLEEVQAEIVQRGARTTVLRIPDADGRLLVTVNGSSLADGQTVLVQEPG